MQHIVLSLIFTYMSKSINTLNSNGLINQLIISTDLKVMMLGCLSFRRCLMSVSLMFRTFFTATSCPCSLPRKTAPWAPLPTHWRSDISSNGTSHSSEEKKEEGGKALGWWVCPCRGIIVLAFTAYRSVSLAWWNLAARSCLKTDVAWWRHKLNTY